VLLSNLHEHALALVLDRWWPAQLARSHVHCVVEWIGRDLRLALSHFRQSGTLDPRGRTGRRAAREGVGAVEMDEILERKKLLYINIDPSRPTAIVASHQVRLDLHIRNDLDEVAEAGVSPPLIELQHVELLQLVGLLTDDEARMGLVENSGHLDSVSVDVQNRLGELRIIVNLGEVTTFVLWITSLTLVNLLLCLQQEGVHELLLLDVLLLLDGAGMKGDFRI